MYICMKINKKSYLTLFILYSLLLKCVKTNQTSNITTGLFNDNNTSMNSSTKIYPGIPGELFNISTNHTNIITKNRFDDFVGHCDKEEIFECDEYCDLTEEGNKEKILIGLFSFLGYWFVSIFVIIFVMCLDCGREKRDRNRDLNRELSINSENAIVKKKSEIHNTCPNYLHLFPIRPPIDTPKPQTNYYYKPSNKRVKKSESSGMDFDDFDDDESLTVKKPITPVPADKSASFVVTKRDETDDEKMLDEMIAHGIRIPLDDDQEKEKQVEKDLMVNFNYDLTVPENRKKAFLYLKKVNDAKNGMGNNVKRKTKLKDFTRKGTVFIPRDVADLEFNQQCDDAKNVELKEVFFEDKENEVYSIGTDIDEIELDQDSSIGSSVASSRAASARASTTRQKSSRAKVAQMKQQSSRAKMGSKRKKKK